MTWLDDDLFHLKEWSIFEDIVDTPWTIPDFEISSFAEILWERLELFFEFFLISFIERFFQEVARVMRLRTETIDDTDSLRAQEDCLWYLCSESVSSLREDNLTIFTTRLRLIDEHLETSTHTPVCIDSEKYSIYRLQCTYDFHTKFFILEALHSAFHLCLMIIIYDDPEFIGSGF